MFDRAAYQTESGAMLAYAFPGAIPFTTLPRTAGFCARSALACQSARKLPQNVPMIHNGISSGRSATMKIPRSSVRTAGSA